jgi:hypothetical protein
MARKNQNTSIHSLFLQKTQIYEDFLLLLAFMTNTQRLQDAPSHSTNPNCTLCTFLYSFFSSNSTINHQPSFRYGESPDGGREETDEWIKANTRPCPACGSPIEKTGGCNAMVCGACRSPFCWACMRAKSACGHTRCANGAPFGDFRERGDGILAPAADTPAARAAALTERAGLLTVIVSSIGGGAVLSGLYGADSFSAVRWSASLCGRVAMFTVTAGMYVASAAAAGVMCVLMFRVMEDRRRRFQARR